jgi:hypothetical protein
MSLLAYDIYKTNENYNKSENTIPKTISAFKNGAIVAEVL